MRSVGDNPQQNFIAKFLKRPHAKGFSYEFGQMLTNVAAAKSITQNEINELLIKNSVKQITPAISAAATVELMIVARKATAKEIANKDTKYLISLADVLGADIPKVNDSISEASLRHFQDAYQNLIASGRITSEVRDNLIEFGRALGLSDTKISEGIANIAQPMIDEKLRNILEDTMMSPDEETLLFQFAADIGIKLVNDADTQLILDIAKQRWAIFQGDLPEVDCPIMLKKGEKCHAVITSTAYEERTRTVRIGYSGVSTKIKIVKGIYYNAGSYNAMRKTESYSQTIGNGHLMVTNKRIIFNSDQKNAAFSLDSIVDWTLYSDGVELRRATGKPVTYVFNENTGLFLETLIAARGKLVG